MIKDEVMRILEEPEWNHENLLCAMDRYELAYSRCTGGAIRYDKECVQGGGGDPDMPMIMVAQRSMEVDKAKARYEHAKGVTKRFIKLLRDERKEAVLVGRYVTTPVATWPELAQQLGVSERTAYRLKNEAIEALCAMDDAEVYAAVA